MTQEKLNSTDTEIVKICKKHLQIEITELTYIIGTIDKSCKAQLICQFRNWKIKNQILKLKASAHNIVITEDLTRYRQFLVIN